MLKEIFLNKLKERFSENLYKYDYSLVPNEIKYKDKVKIVCKTHGVFEQIVGNHLLGKGCNECGIMSSANSKKYTIEEFIAKARQVHNDKYNYSKVNINGTSKEIIIGCHVHGDYSKNIYKHLNGQGCQKCGRESIGNKLRSNVEDFIIKANEVHNYKYTYSKTIYKTAIDKLIITCPIHGDFEQVVNAHLNGASCPKCNGGVKYNLDEFISKARFIHENKYNYHKVIYINSISKVIITCPVHGDFEQVPRDHLNGNGCHKCKESNGEKYISNILNKYDIKHIREYRILPYRYFYDFYLPEYDIYIEYHGMQHYKPIDYFGGSKQFRKTKRNDRVKIELIKRSIGLLIVLKYTFDSLNKIEDELLRLFGVLHSQFLNDKESTKQIIIDSKIFLIKKGIAYIRS